MENGKVFGGLMETPPPWIVACQRGGVSNKPPGLQAATNLVIATYKNLKKKNGPYIRPVFTKTG